MKGSGILEARTVHGQALKVHSSDVANKADLLLDRQRKQLAELYECRDEQSNQDFGENLRQGKFIWLGSAFSSFAAVLLSKSSNVILAKYLVKISLGVDFCQFLNMIYIFSRKTSGLDS